jgi:hypothetical protein
MATNVPRTDFKTHVSVSLYPHQTPEPQLYSRTHGSIVFRKNSCLKSENDSETIEVELP